MFLDLNLIKYYTIDKFYVIMSSCLTQENYRLLPFQTTATRGESNRQKAVKRLLELKWHPDFIRFTQAASRAFASVDRRFVAIDKPAEQPKKKSRSRRVTGAVSSPSLPLFAEGDFGAVSSPCLPPPVRNGSQWRKQWIGVNPVLQFH